MTEKFLALVGARRGHFLYESGYHGELWLDLERLCFRPQQLAPLVRVLVERVRAYAPEIVCGPLVEGAFIGLMVAQELGCGFV